MRLDSNSLKDASVWTEKGYALPDFDVEKMKALTVKDPVWIHFGAGNIFRAFLAKAAQKMLNEGDTDRGIIAAESRDCELAHKIYHGYDNLTILAEFGADGELKKSVLGSIAEICSPNDEDGGSDRMKEIMSAPSLQLAGFTITEKGYKLTDSTGKLLPEVEEDMKNGPDSPKNFIGLVASMLYARYISGAYPVAMVSMDNCSDNGTVLFNSVSAFVDAWTKNGLVKEGFDKYIRDGRVSFPVTMIDKITPGPDPTVEEMLNKDGVEDISRIITAMHSCAAGFVNAEETGYLVIEDVFPNGRPPFEKCGFLMTDRDTVKLTEKMKVSSCLNPLHTAMAVYGCMLGYKRICDETHDAQIAKLIRRLGYDEGLPSAPGGSVIDPRSFLDEVINVRLPNPHIPDMPQRIASDTSMKISVRFGETIKFYAARNELDKLEIIPLVIAGWLRYLMAVDDEGNSFERSPDPFLADSRAEALHALELGCTRPDDIINSILSDSGIFGSDISKTPLAEKVLAYFEKLSSGKGAVRAALTEVLG